MFFTESHGMDNRDGGRIILWARQGECAKELRLSCITEKFSLEKQSEKAERCLYIDENDYNGWRKRNQNTIHCAGHTKANDKNK